MVRPRFRALASGALGVLALVAALAPGAAVGQTSTNGQAVVTPAKEHDPGDTVTVANATDTPRDLCGGTQDRTVSVDVLTSGDGIVSGPHIVRLTSVEGRWSVPVDLAPTLAPGAYKAVATCYANDNSRQRTYDPVAFSVRLQAPGAPTVRPAHAQAGDAVQIGAGSAKCPPPKGAAAPRVRASILDGAGTTRAESEADVNRDGSWSVTLKVPSTTPQTGAVTAVCLAGVSASAPYARYATTPFAIDEEPKPSTTTTPPTVPPPLAPGQTTPPVTPPAPTTTRGPTPRLPGFTDPLPPSPVAVPILAEPTYTG